MRKDKYIPVALHVQGELRKAARKPGFKAAWSALEEEYAALGIDTFIFSGYPHLEEAYRFAELVFPLLPRSVREKLPGQVLSGPFGEVMATGIVPRASQS